MSNDVTAKDMFPSTNTFVVHDCSTAAVNLASSVTMERGGEQLCTFVLCIDNRLAPGSHFCKHLLGVSTDDAH